MTNLRIKSRWTGRAWCNGLAILVAICLFAAAVVFVGRLPTGGAIQVSGEQSDRFSEIMKRNGVILWSGLSWHGMMHVPFDNPFALVAVDDDVLADARRHNYRAIIKYRCIIPYFNYSIDTKYQ